MTTPSEEKNKDTSLGSANSSGSPLSKDSGFTKAHESDSHAAGPDGEKKGNPFGVTNPDAIDTPGGSPDAVGTGTSSPHISENPDKQ